MLSYYFSLGLRSLKRNPVLTALMVLTLALGVAASVSTLTILHVMSGDPIPQKSDRLFTTIIDNGPNENFKKGDEPNDHQLTYKDVANLLALPKNEKIPRRAALYGMNAVVEPARADLNVMELGGMAVTADLFTMFDVPFLFGQAWKASEDASGADVVVLSRKTAEKIFGSVNPVGQKMKMMKGEYTVVGVFDEWRLRPRFYSFNGRESAFTDEEQFFVPFSNAIRRETSHAGSMSCSGRREVGWQGLLDSECTWFHFWFEVKSASDRQQLQSFMDSYIQEQQKLGRFPRHAPNRIFNVREWLDEMKIIGDDSKLSAWLAFGFLLLCLVNTVGLLLAKFSVRSAEIGVRRALGASRKDIMTQFLIESAVVGLVGALVGVLLAFAALQLLALQSKYLAAVAHMDMLMLALTVLMSVSAALLAGLLPTWRACQITPAIQLKSQ
jgi:putative ABC transport system permease protein